MVKCPACGANNPNYLHFCGSCGQEIPELSRKAAEGESESAPAEAKPVSGDQSGSAPKVAVPQEATKKCNWCGTYNRTSASVCANCGRDPYRITPYDAGSNWEPAPEPVESSVPVIGGILAILAGILALAQGIVYMMADNIAYTMGYDIGGMLCACGGIDVLFGLASVVGGVFAIQRKHFALAIIGGILGMLGLGLMIGFLLGLIAVILIATSKVEFDD